MAEFLTTNGDKIEVNAGAIAAVRVEYLGREQNAVLFIRSAETYTVINNATSVFAELYLEKDGCPTRLRFVPVSFNINSDKSLVFDYNSNIIFIGKLDNQYLEEEARKLYFVKLRESVEFALEQEHDMKALFAQKKLERVV